MKYRNEHTYQTRNEIKDLVFEQFSRRTTQHRPLSSSEANNKIDVNTKQGPVNKVFATTELLEGILSNLSTIELVKVRRVSKTVSTVTKTSPIIRSKLFLRPVHLTTTVNLNVFIRDSIPDSEQPCEYAVAELNPLLQVRDSYPPKLIAGLSSQEISHIVFFNPRITLASCWTNMYLTNPPCTKVIIRLVYSSFCSTINRANGKHYHITADRTVYREDGVTFGMLMEAAYLDGRTKVTEYAPRTSLRSMTPFANDSVASVLQMCEKQSQCCKLQLDLDETLIKLVGVALRTEENTQDWEKWGLEMAQQHYYDWPEDEVSVEVRPGKIASNSVERFARRNAP